MFRIRGVKVTRKQQNTDTRSLLSSTKLPSTIRNITQDNDAQSVTTMRPQAPDGERVIMDSSNQFVPLANGSALMFCTLQEHATPDVSPSSE
jgi:hypothetical protein